MTKNIVLLLLIITLVVSQFGCSKSVVNTSNLAEEGNSGKGSNDLVRPYSNTNEEKDNGKEINILIYKTDKESLDDIITFERYKYSFEKELGVKVNYQVIGEPKRISVGYDGMEMYIIDDSWIEDFLKEASVRLYAEDGPELILLGSFCNSLPIKPFIDQGAVIDLQGKLKNINNIYDGLVEEKMYYVPIGMSYQPMGLNKEILSNLDIQEPGFDWTKEDYLNIRDQWLKNRPIRFEGREYTQLLQRKLEELKVLNIENKTVTINTPEVIEMIEEMREYFFSERYILPVGYTYENYYNLIYDIHSEEYKDYLDMERLNSREVRLDFTIPTDVFRAKEVSDIINKEDYYLLSKYKTADNKTYIETYGFLVNSNGKNTDLALKFIDGLLSDDIQMDMYENQYEGFYPVNKMIEDDILTNEREQQIDSRALELKTYILNQLSNENYDIEVIRNNMVEYKISKIIEEDFVRYIFADKPYSEEELKEELRKLENKCAIYLNE